MRRFLYRPIRGGPDQELPAATIFVAPRAWHYTPVVPKAQVTAQQGPALDTQLPAGAQPPPSVIPRVPTSFARRACPGHRPSDEPPGG